jgi:hypothetical protein
VVAVGTPPPAVVSHLLGGGLDHPRIWPLATRSAEAVAVARRALGAERVASLERAGVTIGELLTSLSR